MIESISRHVMVDADWGTVSFGRKREQTKWDYACHPDWKDEEYINIVEPWSSLIQDRLLVPR